MKTRTTGMFPPPIFGWVLAGLLCLGPAISAEPVLARGAGPGQTARDAVDSVPAEDLDALAAKIESDQGREQLLREIRALATVQRQKSLPGSEKPLSEHLAETVSRTITDTSQGLVELRRFFPNKQALDDWVQNLVSDPVGVGRKALQAWPMALVFGVAWLAEILSARLLAPGCRRLEARAHESMAAARLPLTLGRGFLRLGAVAAFAGAGLAVFFVLQPGGKLGQVILQAAGAYIAGRILLIAARVVLSPSVPFLRLVPVGPQAAKWIFTWVRRILLLTLGGYLLGNVLLLFGLPPRGFEGLMNLLGMVLLAMMIVCILRHRAAVAGWIRGPEDGSAERRTAARTLRRALAAVWHLLAIGYLSAFFVVWWQSVKGGLIYLARGTLLSALVLLLAWVFSQSLQRVADRWCAGREAPPQGVSRLRARAGVYLPMVLNAVRVGLVLVAALLILEAWSVEAFQWFKAHAGQRLLGVVFSIAVVAAAAVAVWEAANLAIERYLADAAKSGWSGAQSARALTLLPLMRKALLLVLIVIVSLITFSELGIHIGPLLAGAGIIGLAVGFGAQKLVQDIITGVFILLEDAVAVGDVVKVAGIGGQVEDLSIRSIRLRDLSGNVHTIPFSSVDTVTNMTRLFSYYLIDIGVAYREDTDQVAEVCRLIVDDMRSEPGFAAEILEPLEVLGVDQFADSAVIIKARIKTRPIKQWMVGREFNRRMKKRFDELGIEIPFPHRTLYFGVAKDGSAPSLHMVEGQNPASNGS